MSEVYVVMEHYDESSKVDRGFSVLKDAYNYIDHLRMTHPDAKYLAWTVQTVKVD